MKLDKQNLPKGSIPTGEHLKSVLKARRAREATYRDKFEKKTAHLNPKDKRRLNANPDSKGVPRRFKLLIGGHDTVHVQEKVHDPSFYVDEGHVIHFPNFGVEGHGIHIDNTWVPPSDVHLSADKKVYTFQTKLSEKDGGGVLSGHINFLSHPTPHGLLVHNAESVYAVILQGYTSDYDITVAKTKAAYFSPGKNELVWDTTSSDWKNAEWENNAGVFAFDVFTDYSDPNMPINVIEVGWTDSKSATPAVPPAFDWGLTYQQSSTDGDGTYLTTFDTTGTDLTTTVYHPNVIPAPPPARASSTVTSLFPQLATYEFDSSGYTLVGAYLDVKGNCFAIQGTAIMPSFSTQSTPVSSTKTTFSSVPPAKGAFPTMSSAVDPSLSVNGLLNLNPMLQDKDGQWYDACARQSMGDFHDGIVTYMDETLRSTFISSSVPNVDPAVRGIFNNNGSNGTFYNNLQVPFLASALSGSTQDSAALLNGARANKVLQDQPSQSPIYQNQSSALYTNRFLLMYPVLQQYLNDQRNNNYTSQIRAAQKTLNDNLAARIAGVPDPNGTQAANLKACQADVNNLADYAVAKKLYWAFMLLYYCQLHYLPLLQGKMASSASSANVAMELKSYGAVFGILEASGQPNPAGLSFQKEFNDMIRAFQISVQIPQFVDSDGNSTDFNEIIDALMQEFMSTYSSDPAMQQEAQAITTLLQDRAAIGKFMGYLAAASRMTASLTSWSSLVNNMYIWAEADGWYTKIPNGAAILSVFGRLACAGFVVMAFLTGGGWASMTDITKAVLITNMASLFVTFSVKFGQGVARLISYWNDITPFMSRVKLFFGYGDEMIDQLPQVARDTQQGFSKWFIRTAKENMALADEGELTVPLKIFGRNASEFLANVVGTVLGLVNIALTAWDLITAPKGSLQYDMDVLNMVSASISVIGIAAGWIASAAVDSISVLAVGVLEVCASVAGPLSIAFAVAGMIVMIVMMTEHQDPPDPVKDFATNQAADAGLYMPQKTSIDYFNVIPPGGPGGISQAGLAFQNGTRYLKISKGSGKPFVAPVLSDAHLSYLPDTCLSVQTDSNGNTTIWTSSTDVDNTITQQVCLTVDNNGLVSAISPPTGYIDDGKGGSTPNPNYATQLQQQQWNLICQTKGSTCTIDQTTYQETATFQIQSKFSEAYLALDTSGNVIMSSTPATWTATMTAVGPSTFSYSVDKWSLLTTSMDQLIVPRFNNPGSSPLTWSVYPDLPAAAFQLVTTGTDAGTIQLITGQTPAQMDATPYTITATATINNQDYSQQATVTIEVDLPPAPGITA